MKNFERKKKGLPEFQLWMGIRNGRLRETRKQFLSDLQPAGEENPMSFLVLHQRRGNSPIANRIQDPGFARQRQRQGLDP